MRCIVVPGTYYELGGMLIRAHVYQVDDTRHISEHEQKKNALDNLYVYATYEYTRLVPPRFTPQTFTTKTRPHRGETG